MDPQEKSPAIGIDLGTTYSCVAVFQYGTVEIIANDLGHRTTPSYVAFTDKGRLIGDAAKAQVASNPENTVYDAKRLIGRRFNEESVQEDVNNYSFDVIEEDGKPNIKVSFKNQSKSFTPEEISSMILTKMKETAEDYLGKKVTDAVITVPAYFNNAQRQATKDAGAIAGLNVLRIINEPTAAAIAYGLDKRSQGEKNILVFDLGGGTFDVSILTLDDGVFEVKSTSGDTHLGGEDFDSRLVSYFAQEFKKKHGDISNDKRALRLLRSHCEQAKLALSSSSHATIEVPSLFEGVDFKSSITRAKFEDLCADLFQSTLKPVERALADADLNRDQIDEVILVGGSTRIPKIQRLLQEFFNNKKLNTDINPDEAIAYGAAVQAAIVSGDDPNMCQDLLLLDVLPLSLGIETVGGVFSTIIPRNSTIPAQELHYATTNYANQNSVFVTVYEGERQLTKDNNLLGEFELGGIRPGSDEDLPIITVTFEVDANGILNVSAVDNETGASNQITISNEAARLSEDEIERMRATAEQFRQADEEEYGRIQARNSLERYVDQIQSTISQPSFSAKASHHEQQDITRKLEDVSEWIDDNAALANKQQIEAKFTELKNVCQPIIEHIYQL